MLFQFVPIIIILLSSFLLFDFLLLFDVSSTLIIVLFCCSYCYILRSYKFSLTFLSPIDVVVVVVVIYLGSIIFLLIGYGWKNYQLGIVENCRSRRLFGWL